VFAARVAMPSALPWCVGARRSILAHRSSAIGCRSRHGLVRGRCPLDQFDHFGVGWWTLALGAASSSSAGLFSSCFVGVSVSAFGFPRGSN
jgi:hypothetical protein